MSDNRPTIADIEIQAGIAYQSVCDIKITSQEGTHGRLQVLLEVSEEIQPRDVQALYEQTVIVRLKDGTKLFSGICTGGGLSNNGGYKQVRIEAATHSVRMDCMPMDRTFQDPAKTLQKIADEIGSAYGAQITLDKDVPITEIVSQKGETDWNFLSRIAASWGKVIYTDILSDTINIFVGMTGIRNGSSDDLGECGGVTRNNTELSSMNANLGRGEGYEVDVMSCETRNLNLAAGDNAGIYAIRSGEITAENGIIVNRVSYGYPPSVRPSVEAFTQPDLEGSILQGTVLQVAGNEIQVQFDTDAGGGGIKWIPYESAISNSFYCMPDEGDTVYVYYENNGNAVCLGSHHVNTDHPDMLVPDEKVLTNKDKMMKFSKDGIILSATRELTDADSDNAVSIAMGEGTGITVTSGREIIWVSGGEIRLGVNEPGDADEQAARGKKKLEERIKEGKDSFAAEGGNVSSAERLWQREVNKFKNGMESNVVVAIGRAIYDRFNGEADPEPDAEQFETGVLTLYGYQYLDLVVGSSCISLDSDVHVYADEFWWLGYERGSHSSQEKPLQDWWETTLDVIQLGLDIAGYFPAVGIAADLINAGISLMRGDISGAILSTVAAVPIVGDAVGGGGKIIKGLLKTEKAVAKAEKILTVAGGVMNLTKGVYMMAQSAYSLYLMKDQLAEAWENKELSPENISLLINAGRCTVMFVRGVQATKSGMQILGPPLRGALSKAANGFGTRVKNLIAKIDPVNVVTGSLFMEYEDLALKDIHEDFILKRRYESIYTNEGMLLGSRWFLNIETRLQRTDDRVTLQKPDMGLEYFRLTDGRWVSEKNGDESYRLTSDDEGYTVWENETGKNYQYDADGKLRTVTDANGNVTCMEYQGGVLSRMTLPGGQFLDFIFRDGKLDRIEDTIKRRISYAYEGDLLTKVTLPNGGVISYEYTHNGHVHSITDQNGYTYVTTEFDFRGRATRQVLSTGDEFIIHYDDRNKKNTFTNPANGECTIYEYGRQKVVTKQTNADGTYMEKKYDAYENCIYERDFNGNETFREYDIRGNLLRETTPDGITTEYAYDGKGRMTLRTDTEGAEEVWEYGSTGLLERHRIKIEENRYAVTAYTYDSRGRVLTETNPLGNEINYDYEGLLGEPAAKFLPEGEATFYRYDDAGRLMSEKNAAGTTGYGYNRRDDLTLRTDPMGNTTYYGRDLLGNMTELRPPIQYAAGMHGIRYRYDSMDRMVSAETPEGNLYLYRYGSEDSLTLSIHPNEAADGGENGIRYDYDDRNRRIRAHYPDGGCERYFYDGNSNIIKRVPPGCYDEEADDGAGYVYVYDSMDRLTSITNPMGEQEAEYAYDHSGRVIRSQEDGAEQSSILMYNKAGWLTQVRIPMDEEDGKVRYRLTVYGYDDMGQRTMEKRYLDYQTMDSASGKVNTISYHYDKSNRLVKVTDDTGACMEYTYDNAGRRTAERMHLDGTTCQEIRYYYDAAGRITRRCEKLEDNARYMGDIPYAITSYAYDANSNLTRVTFPEGGMTDYTYNNDNLLVKERHHEEDSGIDMTFVYRYDHAGNLISVTDSGGNVTEYTYDLLDRETAQKNPDGGIRRREYDRDGRLICEVSPQENADRGLFAQGVRYTYDAAGRRLTATAPGAVVTEHSVYDAMGRIIMQKDGARFGYDLSGRRTSVTTPEGAVQQFAYDAYGNMTAITDGEGHTTSLTVDAWGRITGIRKADGTREQYTYDFAGNMLTATDGEGHTVSYTYNRRGLQESRTDAAGNSESFRYDRDGNMAESTDRNGVRVIHTYNMFHSLTARRSEGGDICENFTYYPDGKLKTAIGGGMRYAYRYDNMGRLAAKNASGKDLLQYTYDLNGNRTGMTDYTGKTTTYRYDNGDRLVEVTDGGRRQARYTYNTDGTLRSMEAGAPMTGGSLRTMYSYDRDFNLTGLTTFMDEYWDGDAGRYRKALARNAYRYDKVGNCVEKATLLGKTKFVYDSLNRLAEASYPEGRREYYTYDKADNRLTMTTDTLLETYTYDSVNRLTERSIHDLAENGQTTYGQPEIPAADRVYQYTYDRQGNTLSDGENIYTYDSLNRLTQINTKAGGIQKNRYDGEGLRAELEENGRLVRFLFHNGEVVLEEPTEGAVTRYIRGYDLISSDSAAAKTYYHYTSDNLGSITHVTDEDGNICNQYEYDAFGSFTTKEETIQNRFCYTGEQYDPITSQYYLRARFYNPVIGRFLNEDTYYGDGLNLYAYCHNNPVNFVDPSGHKMCSQKYKQYIKLRNKGLTHFQALAKLGVPFNSKGKPTKYSEFDIDVYGNFKNYPGDDFTGHELLQFAWLKANGKAKRRGDKVSKNNPAMAIYEDPMHKFISSKQIELGLRNQNLKGMTWQQNVRINIQILKEAGVSRDKIAKLAWATRQYAIDNGF